MPPTPGRDRKELPLIMAQHNSHRLPGRAQLPTRQAGTAAQPALALLAEVREDPQKAYVVLGALLASKIGLIFLIEDLFSPNSRR